MVDSTDDQEVFGTLRDKLTASLVSDALDAVGVREHSMQSEVHPIYQTAVVVGRAYPVQVVEIYDPNVGSFCDILDCVNSLKANDVLVMGCNGSMRASIWGNMLATAAKVRGASGMVCDGAIRDVNELTAMKFPSFAKGTSTLNARDRMMAINSGCPVNCGGVIINPGDIVFGDTDGVVVIPKELVPEVIPLALKRDADEAQLLDRLLKGEPVRVCF
jgi:regulator of RNase E activity RraA